MPDTLAKPQPKPPVKSKRRASAKPKPAAAEKRKRKRDPELRNIETRNRPRSDGSALVTYRVRWIDDTGIRQREEFDTLDEAKEFRDKLEERAALLRKGPSSRASTTVIDAHNLWWNQHVLASLEPRTWDNYEGAWDRHLKHRVVGMLLIDLTTPEIERLKDEMLGDGVGASTVRTALAILGSILSFAARRNMVDYNTALAVEPPKARKKRARRVPPKIEYVERMRALAVARESTVTAVWISLMAYAGLRPGEVRGLRWSMVWSATLVISQTPDPDGTISDTKTHRGRSAEQLRALAADLWAWRAITPYPADSDLVVPAADGGAMSDEDYKNWVKRKFKPVAIVAGWECVPYDLRHFNASLLIKEGRLSNKEIADHLGHTLNELSRTYAHELAEYRGRPVNVQAEIERVRADMHGTEPLLRLALEVGASIEDSPSFEKHSPEPPSLQPVAATAPVGALESLVNLNAMGILSNDELAEKVRCLVA